MLNDETALEILQNKDQIIENSVENLTICKSLYTKFYNQVFENVVEAFRNLLTNELDEIDRDLEHNYFFY